MKVPFVCTGNICRSPMAELMLSRYMPELESDSAGPADSIHTPSPAAANG